MTGYSLSDIGFGVVFDLGLIISAGLVFWSSDYKNRKLKQLVIWQAKRINDLSDQNVYLIKDNLRLKRGVNDDKSFN